MGLRNEPEGNKFSMYYTVTSKAFNYWYADGPICFRVCGINCELNPFGYSNHFKINGIKEVKCLGKGSFQILKRPLHIFIGLLDIEESALRQLLAGW